MARFLSPNLEYALGWTVVHSLWQATVLAFAVGISMIALRKRSAHLRYLVASGGLLATLAASVATFCFYFDFGARSAGAQRLAASPAVRLIVRETRAALTASSNIGFKEYFNRHLPLIVTVWLMGVAIFTLRLLGGVSYVYYLKNYRHKPMGGDWQAKVEWLCEELGVRRAVELVESALVKAPMTIGALKPIILFPIGAVSFLSTEQVEAILAHELAHIRRFDYFFNILQSVVEIVFYFHPAVWWISSVIRMERENCCDDIAVGVSGDSLSYAKALVNLQEIHAGNPILAMGFAGAGPKNQLLNRVKRLLNQPQQTSNIMEKLVATCLLMAIFVGATFSDARAKALLVRSAHSDHAQISEHTLASADSLPKKTKMSATGLQVYSGEVDGKALELKMTDGQIAQLKVNGKIIPKNKYSQYQAAIDEVVQSADMALNNDPPTPPDPASPPDPQIEIANNDVLLNKIERNALIVGSNSLNASTNQQAAKATADASMQLSADAMAYASAATKNSSLFDNMPYIQNYCNPCDLERNQMKNQLAGLISEVQEFETEDPKDVVFYNTEALKVKDIKKRLGNVKIQNEEVKKIEQEMNQIRSEMEDFDDGPGLYPDKKTRFGWQKGFEAELVKDGYVKDPQHYSLNMMSGLDILTVDGRTYSGDVFFKYKDLYERLTGSKFRRARVINYNKGADQKGWH